MKKEIVAYTLDYSRDRNPQYITYPVYKSNKVYKTGDVIRPRICIDGKMICDSIIK